ncbi:MAG: VWA domain-containing protein, partial [Phototrophicales bacterium]
MPAENLVILLDLSRSMDATDVKPSRLARARQEIEDIAKATASNKNGSINIGLIAFAGAVHVITPLTDDMDTMRSLLPSLNTDIVYTQGARLVPALTRAAEMLSSAPGNEKHILVLSDGDFDDGAISILSTEQSLVKQGIHIHAMGIGT